MEGVQGRTRQSASTQLGERVRQLRVAAGLTQTELAGNRFSKEYICQIERGKTRPTQETIDWLAARLKTDAGYLANGVETAQLARAEAMLVARRRRSPRRSATTEAAEAFARRGVRRRGHGSARARVPSGRPASAWARIESGRRASRPSTMLVAARRLPTFASLVDIERAEHLYRIGVGAREAREHARRDGPPHRGAQARREHSHRPGHAASSRSSAGAAFCLQRLKDVDRSRRRDIELAIELGEQIERSARSGTCAVPGVADRRARGPLRPRAPARRARAGQVHGGGRAGPAREDPQQPRRRPLPARRTSTPRSRTSRSAYTGLLDAGQDELIAPSCRSRSRSVHLETGQTRSRPRSRHATAIAAVSATVASDRRARRDHSCSGARSRSARLDEAQRGARRRPRIAFRAGRGA